MKLSILLALTLSSTQALALGLGQIRVKSALNKPLVAEIPLQTDYPGEASDLQVSLASPDQFARAGLDRLSLTVQLKFKVTTNAAGQKVIRVTSDEPVRETFLDFLVKVDWPRGQLLREYTVLLDPPGSEATARLQGAVTPSAAAPPKPAPEPAPKPAKTAAPVKPAPVAKAAPEMKTAAKPVQSKPTPKPAQKKVKPAARPPAASAQVQNGNYGRVRHGQTLWGIAHNQHPGGVSVNQMMLALKSANPDAFYKDNINALKSGAVLRIPTRDELLAQTAAAATAEVLRQDRSWSAMVPHRTTMVASAGPGGASRPGKPASSSRAGTASNRSGDELKLVPPSNGGESTGARAGVAGGSNKVAVEQLHQEVSRAKEALSSAQQQTADLQAHLKSLKDIQSKNNRLLDLKNAEITELQNKLAAADKKPSAAGSALAHAVNGSVPASGSSAAIAMAAAASGAAPA
ncbi:FimV/HubP family polar landmark protein [Oleiagrimonas sp.]|uniref:type IV pilus assembly protein FimV n=1 Tax=Oleiagrimonas sp. TaxID=2010330 RepID=UPI002607A8E3|nr:FimV/HubP family polar landmark protein [Oleiagrimonas sp.]MDA3914434.1 hypothetical protein [Oleiagrimonas sp.]